MKTILVLSCLIAVCTAYSVQEDMLERHNKDRRRHKVGALVTSSKLVGIAQTCANRNAKRNKNAHDCPASKGYGENLSWSYDSKGVPDEKAAVKTAYTGWYNESKDYNYKTGKSTGGATGHFTQVVWKGSKEVGCAYAVNKGLKRAFVACVYSPQGNFNNKYTQNVLKP